VILARVALAAVVFAGCLPNPPTPAPTGTEPTARASAAPTETPFPTATERVTSVAWQHVPTFGTVLDTVRGSDGWVSIGDTCPVVCDPPVATAWSSADGTHWKSHPLPRSHDIWLVSAASNAMGYLVAAYDQDELSNGAGRQFLQFWRSPEGDAWDRVGELYLGSCAGDAGCPTVRNVGLAPSGAIVVGNVRPSSDRQGGGPFVSDDAIDWALVPPASFGVDLIDMVHVQSTPSAAFLFGLPCSDCPLRVWTSTDGHAWADAGEIDAPQAGAVSLAVDEYRRVAAIFNCSGKLGLTCGLEVWTSLGRGPWAKTLAGPDLRSSARVASADGTFVLVTRRRDTYVTFTSSDGTSWFELPANGLDPDVECDVTWLAGGPRTVTLGGYQCEMWRGTLQ
jgi:hypothetical protein